MNRLHTGVPASGSYQGLNFAWSIHSWGNRQSQTVTGSSQQPLTSTPTLTFNNSPTNRADNWSYDAAGDLNQDQLSKYLYDAEGRICATGPISGGMGSPTYYLYDAEGIRVMRYQLVLQFR